MKISILPLSLSLLVGAASVQAQIFQPNLAGSGALIGGIAGAIIGGHNHNALAGAAIGTAAGYIIGSAAQPPVSYPAYPSTVTYVQDAPLAPAAPVYVQQPVTRVVYIDRPAYAPCPPAMVYGGYPYWPAIGLSFGYYHGWGGNRGWNGYNHRDAWHRR